MSDIRPLDRSALEAHPLPCVQAGDKQSKGRILILAGSRNVPGAALLAARAAMRAGAGNLKIATVGSVISELGIAMPEAMVVGLPEHGEGFASAAVDRIAELAERADAVVAGMGVEEGDICRRISDVLIRSPAKLALDAALLRTLEPLDPPDSERSSRPVLLPHAGEMAALLDCREEEVERDPVASGLKAARLYRSIVLVKGVTSHVVTPEGEVWTYEGGAPGLGVSGSGDVLAGMTGGLLARGAEPLTALLWSVWLHGEAGRELSRKIGPLGFLAREIAEEVPGLLPR